MTSQEMMKAKSKLGGWENAAPLGAPPDWIEAPAPESVNLNDDRIFGYEKTAFLQRQYK